jgi:hypothetical protein
MTKRFDLLSRSSSGLNYVRDKNANLMRVLTESELADFDDPPPCPECAEQFGCEHFNCAGEPLFAESEIEANVPARWTAFARDHGLSAKDLERLGTMEERDGQWTAPANVEHDMRTLELVLLLNEER